MERVEQTLTAAAQLNLNASFSKVRGEANSLFSE